MVWDKYANAGATFWKPDVPGAEVVGTIKQIRDGKDFNKNVCPELVLDDGNGGSVVVTAAQALLKAELLEKRPNVGDRVRIRFIDYGEAREGRQAPKRFSVEVKAGDPKVEEATIF